MLLFMQLNFTFEVFMRIPPVSVVVDLHRLVLFLQLLHLYVHRLPLIYFSASAVNDQGLCYQHDRNGQQSYRDNGPFSAPFCRPEEKLFGVIFGHVDEDCDHGRYNGGGFAGILRVISAPLVHNDKIHIHKGTAHEDDLRDGEGNQIYPFASANIVVHLQQQSEHHMCHPEYHSHLHF